MVDDPLLKRCNGCMDLVECGLWDLHSYFILVLAITIGRSFGMASG